MADDKKSDPAPPSELIDDWDSLPLDPDGDDWDELPPPKAAPAPAPESTSPPVMAAPIPPAADPPSASQLPPGAAPPPDSGQIFALLGAEDDFETDDFADHLLDVDGDLEASALASLDEMDELDVPGGLNPGASIVPDEASTETPDEEFNFDLVLSAAQDAEAGPDGDEEPAEAAGAGDFSGWNEPEPESAPPSAPAEAQPEAVADAQAEPEDFNAHLQDPGSTSMMDKIEAELEDLPTKKVELDIEGIFLEDHEPPPPEEEQAPPEAQPPAEAPPPEAPPAAPAESPGPKKIPKIKLLMLLVPALLLVSGLGLGIYKLFFASPAVEEGQGPLVIDPAVPPREPLPGALELGVFYINFPGEQGETIMEMAVVLHYRDLPDRAAIEAQMPLVRDIIYLAAKAQGSQVISNGEVQRRLRQIAAEQANAALGGEHIDYVQISHIRILQ